MPIYEYTAINNKGKSVKGTIDADSTRAARQQLRNQKIFPKEINESTAATKRQSKDVLSKFKQSSRVSVKDVAVATRQLATLIGAGLPLVSALNALSDQIDSPILRRIIVDVREKVEEGSALSQALREFPRAFPPLYSNMIEAGEASGTLHTVLVNLADYLESQLALRTKVRSALMYPVIMIAFCGLVIVALFIFVIPNIVEIFQKQGAVLPLPTRIMIVLSEFFINYWWSIPLVIIGLTALIRWYYRQETGRERIDLLLLKAPIYGPIYLKVCTARFATTLGALLGSGVQLLAALDITRKIMANTHVRQAIEDSREGVREGQSLARELKDSGIFPSMLFHMIAVGEQSGELEGMLSKAGGTYQNEVDNTLEGLTSLLEPIMMIVVGLVVLSIVVSVLLPMADMIDVINQ